MASEAEITKLMLVMALAYPRYELQEQTFKVYSRILSDIPAEVLEKASLHIMSNSTFFPSIAEWRKTAFDLMFNIPALPSQYEAWGIVQEEIRRIGSYGQPQFEHEIVSEAVRIMGWRELCLSEQPEYDRAHFFKIFDSLLKRAEADTRMLPEVRQAALEWSAAPQPETMQKIKQLAGKLTT